MMDTTAFLDNSSGGSASGGGGDDGDPNSAGNRWPRQETLALLKIRSDMDLLFRDSALKAPLWDEVSRKLGELGFHRSAKKCKEKFENVYKYHKRTKDGRSARHNGKSYKFFDQLELLDTQFSVPLTPLSQIPSYAIEPITQVPMAKPVIGCGHDDFTIPVTLNRDRNAEFMSASTSTASSSGKEFGGGVSVNKKNRKLAEYFERLMKDVLEKQEDLQNKFLEALEKCERDRIAREEEWKMQEMARIKREHEFLAQERAIAAAKDAAVLAFLQKITQQQTSPLQIPEILSSLFNKDKQENILEKCSSLQENGAGGSSIARIDKQGIICSGESAIQMSGSRWPKAEVEALIMLKTDLDLKYQDNGPKGPLWEEISTCMKKLGYDRNAKRCKEKWENINKYYKRVKESNKKRPQDSKTCPYFNMLESIYAKKYKKAQFNSDSVGCNLKPEQILMQMMGQNQQQQQPHQPIAEYGDSDNQNQEDDVEDDPDGECGDPYLLVAEKYTEGIHQI